MDNNDDEDDQNTEQNISCSDTPLTVAMSVELGANNHGNNLQSSLSCKSENIMNSGANNTPITLKENKICFQVSKTILLQRK